MKDTLADSTPANNTTGDDITAADTVDQILSQWARARPDVDCSPMGVAGRISRASRLLEKGIKEYFSGHDLEPWEFDVLATLFRSNPEHRLCMSDLAAAAMVSSAALTNRVDRLVARGLVHRETWPANRRMVLITLTDEGRAVVDSLLESHVANEERLLSGLTAEDREQLAALLRKLLTSLGDVRLG
ncbi:MarR family transcriptional regulator [Microbispora rosea subsp. aerata]|nr:MarR family transcriptional regulator [Microbispora rosea]GGO06592.1 MarR family transcriptional regulator [Microbispora rosea subsp. aerata]GIH55093.1 MarR family transcriptional regulator [Microbispora rosea subsp. aerata]GLJ82542.1 MarR family transcriptional regulator [Microbispora rosea subsp. aerata]